MDDFEVHGEWLVCDSERWETGTLRFSQEQGARLELLHINLNKYTFLNSYPLILGRTGMGNVTLINCRHRNSHTGFYSDFGFQVYSAQYVFVGSHYNNLDEIQFEKVNFNLNNLNDWIHFSGLDYKSAGSDKKFTIEYSIPDCIAFSPNENSKGKINFECSTRFTHENERTITIKESCQIELAYEKGKMFNELLADIIKFQNLLSIFIYELSFPLYINFFKCKTDTQESRITFYYQHANYKPSLPQSQAQIVFFGKLNNIFDTVIPNWFKRYEKIESSLFLFLSTLKEKTTFSTEKFLSIVKAIETFHINIFVEKESENLKLVEKYERIINDIQSPRDKKYIKALLYERLRPTLKERLHDFVTAYSNNYLLDKIKSLDDFKNKVSDSRNYYTHLDPKMKEKALRGKELYNLYIKLIALYLSSLYSYLEIKKEVFEDRLKTLFS